MRTLLLVPMFFCFLVGCEDDSLVKNPVVYVKSSSEAPDASCDFLGKVNGATLNEKAGAVTKYEESLKDIKRGVSSLGGNYVHIQKVVRDGAIISGKAYQCDNF